MRRAFAVVLALSTVIACSDRKATVTGITGGAANHLHLTPSSADLAVGGSVQLKATLDAGSSYDRALWSSGSPTVAYVSSLGLTTCVSKGASTIRVTSDHSTDVAIADGFSDIGCDTAHMVPKQVAAGTAPAPLSVVTPATGAPITNATFAFTSNDPAVASVTPAGLATPLTPGRALMSVTQTVAGTVSAVTTGEFYVLGNGSCSLNPTGTVSKSFKFTVQSDPGNHAAQIGLPAAPTPLPFGQFVFKTSATNVVEVDGAGPFVSVTGDWMNTGDCAFIANAYGAIAGQQSVTVQLRGTWTNGALSLTYTVGMNGELSGGPTVYTVTG